MSMFHKHIVSHVRPLILLILVGLGVIATVHGQECPPDKFPTGCVVISPEAARKALADSDTVDAQKKEIAVKDQAIADLKKLLDEMRINFAAISGENTALKQNAVSDRAIIELLLKNTRKKCLPLTICL